ncbi:hypothetical protein L484_023638 [Morus notabilis]|uniref:Uncharacterized protein n=1 Tax=Morus notabilis TaxID=981085 RepID=W9RGV0_9ROSA|nr:hypothetical protein L484_023638 [Morus notabilis]
MLAVSNRRLVTELRRGLQQLAAELQRLMAGSPTTDCRTLVAVRRVSSYRRRNSSVCPVTNGGTPVAVRRLFGNHPTAFSRSRPTIFGWPLSGGISRVRPAASLAAIICQTMYHSLKD